MPREVEFEGRRIEVPDDATDDEVAGILGGETATATAPAPTFSGGFTGGSGGFAATVAPGASTGPSRDGAPAFPRPHDRVADPARLEADARARTYEQGRALWRDAGRKPEEYEANYSADSDEDLALIRDLLRSVETRAAAVKRTKEDEVIRASRAAADNPLFRIAGAPMRGLTAPVRFLGIENADPARQGHEMAFPETAHVDMIGEERAKAGLGEKIVEGGAELAGAGVAIGGAGRVFAPLGVAAAPVSVGLYSSASTPEAPLQAFGEGAALVALAGPLAKVLGGADPGFARRILAGAGSFAGAEAAIKAATGRDINLHDLAHSAGLGGMLATMHGKGPGKPQERPAMTVERAGEVKARALQEGLASPEEVISPERAKVVQAATAAGASPEQAMEILEALGPTKRADGNVAEGFKPTAEVLADPAIPEAQKAAIREAQKQGVETVSSHVEQGRGVAIGEDAAGNVRRVEAPTTEAPRPEMTEVGQSGAESVKTLSPDTAPAAEGMTRLYRGEGREVPAWEKTYFPEMAGNEGRWFTDNPKQAEVYARGPLKYVDVPAAEAAKMRVRDASEGGGEFLLSEALTKYGPQTPKPEGARLGAGLGGASPRDILRAADLPREALNVPGRLLDKPLSRGIEAAGTLLGKGLRATAGRIGAVRRGAEHVRDAWGARRLAQNEFATAKDRGEGTNVQGQGFVDQLADLTPAQRTTGFDYLGNMNDPVLRAKAERDLSPQAVGVLREGRKVIDANEARNAKENLIGAEALRVHGAKEGEVGTHLRREYAKDLEGEVMDHLLRLSGKKATIPPNELKRDKWIVKWGKKDYRKFDTEAEAVEFRRTLVPEEVAFGKDDIAKPMPGTAEAAKKVEIIPPLSAEARKAMGEVTDPGVVIARTIAMQDLQFNRAQALKAFAASRYASKTKQGGRYSPDPIPDDPRYGALAGMYVDRALRSEIVGRFGEREGIDRFFDVMEKATSLWKEGKTIYNPASQMRNAFGNVAFSEAANVSPARPSDYRYVRDAFRVMFAKGGSPEHALRAELARRGISRQTSIGADLEGALQAMAEVRGENAKGLLRRAWNLVRQGPRTTWGMMDSIPKAAAFLKEYRRTGSLDTAETLVRNTFPDYSRAWVGVVTQSRSRGARMVKAVFAPPFVNFLSEAVRIGMRTAAKKPASMATGLAVLATLGSLSKRAAGITDEEEKKLKAVAPSWMNAGSMAVPWFFDRDEEGNAQALDLRYILPLSKEINDLTSGDDGRQSMLGIVNNPILAPLIDAGVPYIDKILPFGKGPILGANRDRFYGGNIADPGGSEQGQREEQLRYLFDAYAPSIATKLTGVGRRKSPTWKALIGQPDRFGDVPDVGRSVLADFGGVTIRPVDVEKETEKRILDFKYRRNEHKRAQNAAEKRGDTGEVERIQVLIDALDKKAEELVDGTGIAKPKKR